jgi:hypothetical protein
LQVSAQVGAILTLDVALQSPQQRGVGVLTAAPLAATFQHAPSTGAGVVRSLLQQAGLADARLARQQQHRRPLTPQMALQQAYLVRPPDKR